jgi:hypothetical protein
MVTVAGATEEQGEEEEAPQMQSEHRLPGQASRATRRILLHHSIEACT